MSKYGLTAMTQGDLPAASRPYWGGEWDALASYDPVIELGEAVINPDGTLTYTPSPIFLLPSGIGSVVVGAAGTGFTSPPSIADTVGAGATYQAYLGAVTAAIHTAGGGAGHVVGDLITIVNTGATFTQSVVLKVTGVSTGAITTVVVTSTGNAGKYTVLPTNATTSVAQASTTGSGTGATFDLTWGVSAVAVLTPGKNYTSSVALTVSGGAGTGATATATIQTGYDLQVFVKNNLENSAATVLTFNCTDAAGAAFTATATFTPPAWFTNQSFNFAIGTAVDVIPATAGKLVTGITSITISGGNRGARFMVGKLPHLTSFYRVGFCNQKDYTSTARVGKAIPDGMESNQETKMGRNEVAALTLSAYTVSEADGLDRFNGVPCTVLLVGTKESTLPTENVVLTQVNITIDRKNNPGDAEAMSDAKGTFKRRLAFVAG